MGFDSLPMELWIISLPQLQIHPCMNFTGLRTNSVWRATFHRAAQIGSMIWSGAWDLEAWLTNFLADDEWPTVR
jgi:hypothetical protein